MILRNTLTTMVCSAHHRLGFGMSFHRRLVKPFKCGNWVFWLPIPLNISQSKPILCLRMSLVSRKSNPVRRLFGVSGYAMSGPQHLAQAVLPVFVAFFSCHEK